MKKYLTLVLLVFLVIKLGKAQSVTLEPNNNPLRVESRITAPMVPADYGSLISEDDLSRLKFYLNSITSGSNGTQIGDLSVSELKIALGTTTGSKDAKVSLKTQDIDRLTVTPSGNVGIGTTSPNNSAILEMNSTIAGFLPPRVNKTQRDNIFNPAEGLTLYNSTEKNLNYYDGNSWNSVLNSSCYKNMRVFNSSIVLQIWDVPAGVEEVMVEMWSGGQGGGILSGGAGGNYGRVKIKTAGIATFSFFVGNGGGGSAAAAVGSNGSNTSLSYPGTSYTVTGGGGAPACVGPNIYCLGGKKGDLSRVIYQQLPAGTYSEFFQGGSGGDSGYLGKGGKGCEWLYQANSAIISSASSINTLINADNGSIPGGGGGSGNTSFTTGGSGGPGMLVIHY